MLRQLYTSGVVQAVMSTRKGFPDHLLFEELINRFALVLPKGGATAGKAGVKAMLDNAKVPEAKYRLGKTKVRAPRPASASGLAPAPWGLPPPVPGPGLPLATAPRPLAARRFGNCCLSLGFRAGPVSYTHLTLPTICSV
eukprot:2503222-Prymnesium_polylepis.1